MKTWIKYIIIGVLVLVCVVSIVAKNLLTKEFLIGQVESTLNCRVQIGSFDISLLSMPIEVTLKDVIVDKRDAVVRKKVPYNERDPLTKGAIELNEMSFDVSLMEVFSKKIQVDKFFLDGLHARVTLYEDGTNSLDRLFENLNKEEPEEKGQSFNVRDNDEFVTHLKSVSINNVSVDVLMKNTGILLRGSDCSLQLEDIKVNPNALEQVNQANLDLTAKIEIFESVKKSLKYGELGIKGGAEVQLFDAKTGEIDPNLALDFAISDSSFLSTQVPYIRKLWELESQLKKFGLDLGNLPQKAKFGRSRSIAGSYKRGRLDVTKDLSVMISDWEVALNKNSWLDSGSEKHEFFIDFSASRKVTASLMKNIDKMLNNLPKVARSGISEKINQQLLVNNKLTMQLNTEGKLSKPKLKLKTKVPSVDGLMKDSAKKGAIDFLKNRFGGKK